MTLPSGKEVFFPGCPQRHFSRQLNEWLSGYRWLKMGKTPVELGLVEPHEMDPRWYDAMELIDSEINRLQAAAYKDK